MKCAVVIVYTGMMPVLAAQKAAVAAIAEYGCMSDTSNIDVYALDENAIVQAIAGKAIISHEDFAQLSQQMDEEAAIKVIFEICKDPLLTKDYGKLGAILSYSLSKAIMNSTNPDLIKSVQILSSDGIEKRISQTLQRQYHFNKSVLETIKWISNLYVKDNPIRSTE